MAAANEVVTLNITQKLGPIEGGRSIYVGTATGGSEYKTGGMVLAEEAGSRFVLPQRWDWLQVEALGLVSRFVSPNLLKLFAETTVAVSTETGLSELKSAATSATAIPAGTPFIGIGIS